jgi:hypothetical protein
LADRGVGDLFDPGYAGDEGVRRKLKRVQEYKSKTVTPRA